MGSGWLKEILEEKTHETRRGEVWGFERGPARSGRWGVYSRARCLHAFCVAPAPSLMTHYPSAFFSRTTIITSRHILLALVGSIQPSSPLR